MHPKLKDIFAEAYTPEAGNFAIVSVEYLGILAMYLTDARCVTDKIRASSAAVQAVLEAHPEWVHPEHPHLFALGPDDILTFCDAVAGLVMDVA